MTRLEACPVCGETTRPQTCATCAAHQHADADAVAAESRDEAASGRDLTADSRDRAAELRDRGAADAELEAGGDATMRQRGTSAREQSGRDRANSAEDRSDAAEDRHEAARERVEALHDRTQADLAAQRALATLESMSDAFLTLDSEWRFTYLNPQTEAILDRRREDLLGKNIWDEFSEAVGSGFDDACRRALREQVAVRFEERYEPLDRVVEIRAFPVPDGLAVYMRDVTRERLRDAHDRQTQRLEALGQVTAGVAHDFNNLLTAIGGFASLGQVDFADAEKAVYYFDQIDVASRKAVALTRQLLSFAREQALAPALIDLNEAVEGLASLLSQLMPHAVDLHLALSPEPVVVFADPSRLEQVLINLVVNSRDAMDGPGSITIKTTASDPGGIVHDVRVPCGWLQVIDTGSGIPEDVLPRIFDPYFSTKPADVGTGLGLATIYGIVSQSDGFIFVDSTVGVGTTMTVALPRGSRPRASESSPTG